ncbi:MAG: hypothetical protein LQ340_006116, partial [Diploschistes diacapsis]
MRENVLPELQAYFESDFWSRLVFQCSSAQPAVRHAIVAFAAIHETIRQSSSPHPNSLLVSTNRRLALQQYSTAIKLLSSALTRPSRDAMELALVCCVLFVCFENVLGNQADAVRHIENGLQICNEWSAHSVDASSSQTSNDFRQHLLPLFAHLDNQATVFLPFRSPKLKVTERALTQQPPVSTKLPTLRQAKTELTAASKQVIGFLTARRAYRPLHAASIPENVGAEFHRLQCDLRTLGLRLDAFVRSHTHRMSARDIRGSYVVKMMHHAVSLMLSKGLPHLPQPPSLGPDAHQARFEAIVSLGRSVLESLKRSAASTPGAAYRPNGVPLFALEYSIVPPLYYVVTECE